MVRVNLSGPDELERCDVCGEPFQGGRREYLSADGHLRIGCDDDDACRAAWSRRGPEERRLLDALRRAYESDPRWVARAAG